MFANIRYFLRVIKRQTCRSCCRFKVEYKERIDKQTFSCLSEKVLCSPSNINNASMGPCSHEDFVILNKGDNHHDITAVMYIRKSIGCYDLPGFNGNSNLTSWESTRHSHTQ